MIAIQKTGRQEWQANWQLVLSCMIAMTWVAAPTLSISLFMEPLHQEFGWSFTQISSGLFIYSIISVFMVPVFGAIVDKYGTRRIGLPGLILNGIAFAAFGLATPSLALWWAGWVAYTLTQLMIGTYVWNGAISAAFSQSRGLAIGVVMGGIALGQLIAPNAARWLIDAYGWRVAFAALGFGWTGVAGIVGLFCFHDPRDRKASATDTATDLAAGAVSGGLTLKQALRNPRFLRIAFAILLKSCVTAGVTIHIIGLLAASGISRGEATAMAGMVGIAALAGQLITGWLADRVSAALLPASCYLLAALGYLLVLQGKGSEPLQWAGVMLVGYASGGAINITTYLTSRYVGLLHFGKIYGVISSCMRIGSGVGPLIAGKIFDSTHTYDNFLIFGIAAACIAALSVFGLGSYPSFDRVQSGSSQG
jgi:predicted MFS family arabinose efflux permease